MTRTDKPIFKWPGGKFRLLNFILPHLPAGTRLVEPFVGSGAVYLNTPHTAALLCDLNTDLIAFYQTLSKRGRTFVKKCRRLFTDDANRPDAYLERREKFNALPEGEERAALFLYLNRHGYNGLVRYNSRGVFNVPFGRYVKPYFPQKEMAAFLERMKECRTTLVRADFRASFQSLKKGDVVYCDPPYIPLSDTANFTHYSGNMFGPEEQRELARLAEETAGRGVTVAVSNHDTAEARALYGGAERIYSVGVRRNISCNGEKREMVNELLAVYQ